MLHQIKKYIIRGCRKLNFDSFLYLLVNLSKKKKYSSLNQLNINGWMDIKHLFDSKDVKSLFDLMQQKGQPFGSKNDFWETYSCDLEEYPLSIKKSINEFQKELKDLNGSEFRFDYGLLTINRHNPDSSELKYSQNYHFDYDSAKVYKIFIFIEQVKLNDGPFHFFSIKDSKKFKFTNIFKYGISDALIMQKQLHPPKLLLNEQDVLSAFAINTRECLHCGARVGPGGFRKMLTLAFVDN